VGPHRSARGEAGRGGCVGWAILSPKGVIRYSPGRTYNGYKRERTMDVAGMDKWAKKQAREMALQLRDRNE
jgi:hypothetical protein